MAMKPDPYPFFTTTLKGLGIPAPEREVMFHPTRKWRVDYLWLTTPHGPLAVEVEGGAFIKGRHVRGGGFRKDLEKYLAMAEMKIWLVRYLPEQVNSGMASRWLSENWWGV